MLLDILENYYLLSHYPITSRSTSSNTFFLLLDRKLLPESFGRYNCSQVEESKKIQQRELIILYI